MMIQRPHTSFSSTQAKDNEIDVHCFRGGSLLSTDHKTDNSSHAPVTKIPSLRFFFSFLFSPRLTVWIGVQSTSLNPPTYQIPDTHCHIPQVSIHLLLLFQIHAIFNVLSRLPYPISSSGLHSLYRFITCPSSSSSCDQS